MYEVEVKVKAAIDTVRDRLADSDATRRKQVHQRDTYYDAPHRDFGETDEALRIRTERRIQPSAETVPEQPVESTVVTYKGPLVEAKSKTRKEFETGVEDGDTMAAILDALGFTPVATVEKERTVFDLAGYTVTLDVVSDLGEFVEVEAETTESEVDRVRNGAFEVLRSLGLDPDDQIRTSYLGLLLEDD